MDEVLPLEQGRVHQHVGGVVRQSSGWISPQERRGVEGKVRFVDCGAWKDQKR